MFEFAQLLLRLAGDSTPVFACAGAALLGDRGSSGPRHGSPPLTKSAIAGIIHDANLDPSSAMRDLGYAPDRRAPGLPRCFDRCLRPRAALLVIE